MKEYEKWRKERYAVNISKKLVFEIDDLEVVGDEVIIYAGSNSNTSKKLMTINEAKFFEEVKEDFKKAFF
jgi:hypothetical protein